ncbi:unnamed protein product [Amoebophrya sp. A120]|nr:unnamed protein product [Amoebophrya sp. A120]|eukprot:GSA120T00023929001.1
MPSALVEYSTRLMEYLSTGEASTTNGDHQFHDHSVLGYPNQDKIFHNGTYGGHGAVHQHTSLLSSASSSTSGGSGGGVTTNHHGTSFTDVTGGRGDHGDEAFPLVPAVDGPLVSGHSSRRMTGFPQHNMHMNNKTSFSMIAPDDDVNVSASSSASSGRVRVRGGPPDHVQDNDNRFQHAGVHHADSNGGRGSGVGRAGGFATASSFLAATGPERGDDLSGTTTFSTARPRQMNQNLILTKNSSNGGSSCSSSSTSSCFASAVNLKNRFGSSRTSTSFTTTVNGDSVRTAKTPSFPGTRGGGWRRRNVSFTGTLAGDRDTSFLRDENMIQNATTENLTYSMKKSSTVSGLFATSGSRRSSGSWGKSSSFFYSPAPRTRTRGVYCPQLPASSSSPLMQEQGDHTDSSSSRTTTRNHISSSATGRRESNLHDHDGPRVVKRTLFHSVPAPPPRMRELEVGRTVFGDEMKNINAARLHRGKTQVGNLRGAGAGAATSFGRFGWLGNKMQAVGHSVSGGRVFSSNAKLKLDELCRITGEAAVKSKWWLPDDGAAEGTVQTNEAAGGDSKYWQFLVGKARQQGSNLDLQFRDMPTFHTCCQESTKVQKTNSSKGDHPYTGNNQLQTEPDPASNCTSHKVTNAANRLGSMMTGSKRHEAPTVNECIKALFWTTWQKKCGLPAVPSAAAGGADQPPDGGAAGGEGEGGGKDEAWKSKCCGEVNAPPNLRPPEKLLPPKMTSSCGPDELQELFESDPRYTATGTATEATNTTPPDGNG